MSLCHGWGWQPPQTASHIHIRHIQSLWAHWYNVDWHAVSALHSYTHSTLLRFWGSGSHVESKWCDYVMVEANSHLNLLPTSILNMYNMFEQNWYAVHRHMVGALHSYTHPTWLRYWGSGSLVESNDIIMSWLRLTATLNCFPHPYWTYTKFLSTLICCPLAYSISLTQLYPPYFPQICGSGSHVESKWCHYIMVEADSHLKLLPTSILDIFRVFEHIDMLSICIW